MKFELMLLFFVSGTWKKKTQGIKHWGNCTSGESKWCGCIKRHQGHADPRTDGIKLSDCARCDRPVCRRRLGSDTPPQAEAEKQGKAGCSATSKSAASNYRCARLANISSAGVSRRKSRSRKRTGNAPGLCKLGWTGIILPLLPRPNPKAAKFTGVMGLRSPTPMPAAGVMRPPAKRPWVTSRQASARNCL